MVSLLSYKNISRREEEEAGGCRKNGPKNFTLIDYIPLSGSNMNKQGYLFAVAGAYLRAVMKA